jgi:hypothetical protein
MDQIEGTRPWRRAARGRFESAASAATFTARAVKIRAWTRNAGADAPARYNPGANRASAILSIVAGSAKGSPIQRYFS